MKRSLRVKAVAVSACVAACLPVTEAGSAWPWCARAGSRPSGCLNTSHSGIPVIARKNTAISGMLIQNQFT